MNFLLQRVEPVIPSPYCEVSFVQMCRVLVASCHVNRAYGSTCSELSLARAPFQHLLLAASCVTTCPASSHLEEKPTYYCYPVVPIGTAVLGLGRLRYQLLWLGFLPHFHPLDVEGSRYRYEIQSLSRLDTLPH